MRSTMLCPGSRRAAWRCARSTTTRRACSPAIREVFRARGSRIAKFPITRETAAVASTAGKHVMMGAPNPVRAELCDALASDDDYPAMLQAPWHLAGGHEDLAKFWPLVSANAAGAVGFADRGTLAPGMRADTILAGIGQGAPCAIATFVAGRLVFDATGGRVRNEGLCRHFETNLPDKLHASVILRLP
jgi:hypothetical protein